MNPSPSIRLRPERRAILEVRSFDQSDEALDFTQHLFRVVSLACERHGWRIQVRELKEGPEFGLRRAALTIDGSTGDLPTA